MQYIIHLTTEQEKALNTDMISIQAWIENAIKEKARRITDTIILQYTDKNPRKILQSERDTIIQRLDLKTAQETQTILESYMESKHQPLLDTNNNKRQPF